MGMPNKMYMGFDEKTNLESYCLVKKKGCDKEYISKDLLLEWLRPSLSELSRSQFNKMWLQGYDYMREALIEKIESL